MVITNWLSRVLIQTVIADQPAADFFLQTISTHVRGQNSGKTDRESHVTLDKEYHIVNWQFWKWCSRYRFPASKFGVAYPEHTTREATLSISAIYLE